MKKAPSFNKEEKGSFWLNALPWALVVIGLAAIVTMIANNHPRKPLVCQSRAEGTSSLTSFGSCTTEQ